MIAEYEDDVLVRKFIYGPGIDEPICMIDVDGETETKYYYHFDGLGSVVALSNVNGQIVERYSYDVFGDPNRTSSVGNPYMFTGRRYDSETALYYYRARYYNSEIGRFLQNDPIPALNLYTYCGNNPLNWIDPLGLCKKGGGYNYWSAFSGFGGELLQALADGIHLTAYGASFGLVGDEQYVDYLQGQYGGFATASRWLGGTSTVATAGAGAVAYLGLDVALWGGTAASNPQAYEGMQLWRQWGGSSGPLSPGSSTYWTNVNPQTVTNFSNAAKLPAGNTGQFISTGELTNTTNVIMQQVIGGTVYEVIAPNGQVMVNSVSGGAI